MSDRSARLAQRIQKQFENIELALERAQQGWNDFRDSGNDLVVDSVALNLHAAYNGIEALFESIATTIDHHRPHGKRWHQELLTQMARPIEDVRPTVISYDSCQMLSHYCRFRHVVRHSYPIELEVSPIRELLELSTSTFTQAKLKLLAFADLLNQLEEP